MVFLGNSRRKFYYTFVYYLYMYIFTVITEEYLEPIHQDSGSGDIILKYKKPQSLTASKIDTSGLYKLYTELQL